MTAACPPAHVTSCRREITRVAVEMSGTALIAVSACATLREERDVANEIDFAKIAQLADRIAARNATRPVLFPLWDDSRGAP